MWRDRLHLQILSKGSRLWWGALLFLGILIVPVTFHLACYIEETGTDSFHPITPNFSVPNSPLSLTPFTQPKGNPPIDLPPVPGAYDALWNHTFGGPNDDMGYAVIEVSGGGFAIAGHTWSFGAGVNNGWLIRLDANGNQLWNRTYGGYDWESCFKVIEVSGGGFALAGYSTSYDAGSNDFWLLRVDANGNHLWNHTYGGALPDGAMSVLEVSSGGFILCGNTASFGVGDADVWVVRTDADGNHLWNQTYGSINYDMAYSVIEVSDGGFGEPPLEPDLRWSKWRHGLFGGGTEWWGLGPQWHVQQLLRHWLRCGYVASAYGYQWQPPLEPDLRRTFFRNGRYSGGNE